MFGINSNTPYSPLDSNQPVDQGKSTSEADGTSQTSLDVEKYQREMERIAEEARTNPNQAYQDAQALNQQIEADYAKAREEISKQYALGSPAYKAELDKLNAQFQALQQNVDTFINILNTINKTTGRMEDKIER
jgi:predicted  nucleic acid-binding Zn-ribbon protein